MRFSGIIGQDAVKNHLISAVRSGKIRSAYIFDGEEGSGKMMVAKAFASYILCENGPYSGAPGNENVFDSCGECPSCKRIMHDNSPDVIYVTHEKTVVSVDDIREQLSDTISTRPYISKKKIYIVDDAEKMNNQAQNALLKTLEEPPDYAVIILLSKNAWSFLPTVLSRCVKLSMKPLLMEEVQAYLMKNKALPDYMARLFAMFSQGNLGKAINAASDEGFIEKRGAVVELMRSIKGKPLYEYSKKAAELSSDKEGLQQFFDLLLLWYRDVLLYKSCLDESRLCFRDESFTIRQQAKDLSYQKINAIFDAIDEARMKINFNVRADVTLTELFSICST